MRYAATRVPCPVGPIADRYVRCKVGVPFGLPDFDAAGKRGLQRAVFPADDARVLGAVFHLIVANHAALYKIALSIEDPDRIQAELESVFQQSVLRFGDVGSQLKGHRVQARQRIVAEIVE